jgi:NitT/TauT family transport system ATP-binding protein
MDHGRPALELRRVGKTYPGSPPVVAVGDVSLDVHRGEIVTVVGPSGCGKSTVLHMIAGLLRPSSGEILVEGVPVTDRIPSRLGYMFQKDTVLPWYTVRQNAGLALRYAGRRRDETETRIGELLSLGGLERFGHLYPYQLSGGMRRRLALLMTLAAEPSLLLMDEPFGALDTHTKTRLHAELLVIFHRLRQTALFVTHDLSEAITLGDRVVVLSGPPSRVLLDQPVTLPRQRDVFTLRETDDFTACFKKIWHVLGEEFRAGEPDRMEARPG